ncbi:MAG TPA: zinc-dependent alcohol dehydrogenase [Blastocatellia bacterium]|nr:zinc-dependent alcohol dehydrogenase [Blastocatellia bacterium]HMX26309.1 zinc-dependent alcohol dehydrogenase [Blastocatellia bacterium]HMY71157.1 zinc-dependent alcohol dehydrogenase [Blastocatellia bacterium]HMZ20813.1 zinc-dependent alcohol dehydrogenase [Blastocatellia bacterium]HNG31662.1 zinc-dependent alcohol dehydrogenase [Blastocatellia bacterium]
MKAAVLRALAEPLGVEELPVPEPGAGEVLIQVAACGVCHSDLHLARGEWDLLKPITKLPLVLGHEVTGTVTALGEGVEGLAVGDRVGVPWLHFTCGECEFCRAGRETLCGKQQITGCTVDGGFAEFIKAKAGHTAKLPDNLSFAEAAPLLCAGLTVHHAMRDAGVEAGQRVAVFGIGGLGHLAVQLAKARGAEVIAVDVAEEKLALARQCGADHAINAATSQAYKEIKKLGGAHVVMVTSGSKAAYETALRSLRRGGTLSIVGMAPEPISLSTVAMVSGEYRIVASAVGTRQDLREVLQLAAEGKVKCHIEQRSFEQVGNILEEMEQGKLLGRVVMTFA